MKESEHDAYKDGYRPSEDDGVSLEEGSGHDGWAYGEHQGECKGSQLAESSAGRVRQQLRDTAAGQCTDDPSDAADGTSSGEEGGAMGEASQQIQWTV